MEIAASTKQRFHYVNYTESVDLRNLVNSVTNASDRVDDLSMQLSSQSETDDTPPPVHTLHNVAKERKEKIEDVFHILIDHMKNRVDPQDGERQRLIKEAINDEKKRKKVVKYLQAMTPIG